MTGRHTGEFLGVPATGRPVDFKGMDVLRVRDGRIVEHRHVEQLLQAMQQIRG
jgi:predicted ester cyclase